MKQSTNYQPQKLSNVHDQPRSIMEVKKSFRYLKIYNVKHRQLWRATKFGFKKKNVVSPVLVFIVLSLPVDVYPAMLGHDSVLLGLS